jgi:acyl transferase domain-containing protein
MAKTLYRTEPVVRAVLDRCDEVFQDQRRETTLRDLVLGQATGKAEAIDPAWSQPAVFAFQCAVTALWASVGIRPHVVSGRGVGVLAAAWCAGVLGLEDGLRFASALGMDVTEASFPEIALSSPALSILSQVNGRAVGPAEALDVAYWREQARTPKVAREAARALADLDVDLVLEIGASPGLGPVPLRDWANGATRAPGTFEQWVAQAYDAGLPVTFTGLFAGEARRRISVPGYPFQRERYWFEPIT